MFKNSQVEMSYSMLLRRFHISFLTALVVFTFFLSPIVAPRVVHGLVLSDNPITVTSRSFFEHFPYYIDLSANAHDAAGTHNRSRRFLTFMSCGSQETHTVPVSKTGNSILFSLCSDTT